MSEQKTEDNDFFGRCAAVDNLSKVIVSINKDGHAKKVSLLHGCTKIPIDSCVELDYHYSPDDNIPVLTLKLVGFEVEIINS